MKRLALIFALLCSAPAWASIAYVSASGSTCHVTTAGTGSACTLAAATTANNDVIVGLAWKTTTRSIKKVVGSATGSNFIIYAQQKNGSGSASAILVCRNCPALTTITPTFSGTTLYELDVAEYSGVSWLGITGTSTATSTHPGLTFTTGDANDWVVVETSSLGNAGIPTANTGNLRQANRTGTTSSHVAGGLIDNTVASAGSVTADATITSGAWSASGVELRTTAPKTYIWPDCDSTHPCVIHHKDTMALGNLNDTLTTPVYIRVQPSLASNLLKLTITHPSAKTISSIVDNNSNTWATGATTTDATNGVTTEIRYVCGAGAGVNDIHITLSATLILGQIFQVSYDEISGIATSSCSDGTSGTNLVQGTINPGSITTTVDGDLIYTFGIDTTGAQENGYGSGWEMPDDVSAVIWEHAWDNFMSMVSVQTTHGAINPTMYVNAMDVNLQNNWSIIAQAFKASSGAGTQPPSGRAWVTKDTMFRNDIASTLSWLLFPTTGNAIVMQSSNPQVGTSIVGIRDNYFGAFTVNPITDTSGDPQQYYGCLGSAAVNRDRVISWTSDTYSMALEVYEIAGAKTSGGGTGCAGNMINHYSSGLLQGSSCGGTSPAICSNIVGDPVFSARLNGTAYSVVFSTSYFGSGPPSGMCVSGGVTPPTCTGNSSDVVFSSIWASGMSDGSHYSTGDPYVYWYTNSTSSKSIDYFMANSPGGSGYASAALEILGEPAASGVRKRVIVTSE